MSERWKHQVISGLAWAVVTLLIITVFDYKNNTFEKIAARFVVFSLIGIFVFGYWSWKNKQNKK